jgi:hypothetical protein
LNFVVAGAIIALITASADTGVKDLGRGGVYIAGHVIGSGSASARDPLVQVETAPALEARILEVGLVSGRTGTADCDTVCGMLTWCLEDVSSIAFVVSLLFIFV